MKIKNLTVVVLNMCLLEFYRKSISLSLQTFGGFFRLMRVLVLHCKTGKLIWKQTKMESRPLDRVMNILGHLQNWQTVLNGSNGSDGDARYVLVKRKVRQYDLR